MAKAKTVKAMKKIVIERFMAKYRGQPCEVCGTTYKTCGHHFCGRGTSPRHIVTPENIIVLCLRHHGPYGKSMNPHSGDPFLVHEFQEWVKRNKPELVEWAFVHHNETSLDIGKIPWKELYEEG